MAFRKSLKILHADIMHYNMYCIICVKVFIIMNFPTCITALRWVIVTGWFYVHRLQLQTNADISA